jgi:hypothetical protein
MSHLLTWFSVTPRKIRQGEEIEAADQHQKERQTDHPPGCIRSHRGHEDDNHQSGEYDRHPPMECPNSGTESHIRPPIAFPLHEHGIFRLLVVLVVESIDMADRASDPIGIQIVQRSDGDRANFASRRILASTKTCISQLLQNLYVRFGRGLPGGVQRYSESWSSPFSRRNASTGAKANHALALLQIEQLQLNVPSPRSMSTSYFTFPQWQLP